MALTLNYQTLIPGRAHSGLVKLDQPICFWGGLDPATARIADPDHPQFGVNIKNKILAIPAITGSSSSSQYLMDLMMNGNSPVAILLGVEDVILATGIVVGREMGYGSFPLLVCDVSQLKSGMTIHFNCDNTDSYLSIDHTG